MLLLSEAADRHDVRERPEDKHYFDGKVEVPRRGQDPAGPHIPVPAEHHGHVFPAEHGFPDHYVKKELPAEHHGHVFPAEHGFPDHYVKKEMPAEHHDYVFPAERRIYVSKGDVTVDQRDYGHPYDHVVRAPDFDRTR